MHNAKYFNRLVGCQYFQGVRGVPTESSEIAYTLKYNPIKSASLEDEE